MKALRAFFLLAAVLCGPAAVAHAVVKTSVPAQGAKLAVAPREVVITFNEKLEKMFTSATVKNAAGATVATPKAVLDPANPAVLRLALPALGSGGYVVKWIAVGHDGHRRNGELAFSVN